MKSFCVYIMTNHKHGTLYVGVTSDPVKRIWEHREGVAEGSTKAHDLKTLVYLETCPDAEIAITREKKLKKWRRQWKINLIEKDNPNWDDLYEGMFT